MAKRKRSLWEMVKAADERRQARRRSSSGLEQARLDDAAVWQDVPVRTVVTVDHEPLGRGADEALRHAVNLMRSHEQDRPSYRDRRSAEWSSARPAGPLRSLSAEDVAGLGYTPPGKARPAPLEGSGSSPEVAARAARMAAAASEVRLGKEIRAYATLDRINAAWQARGRK